MTEPLLKVTDLRVLAPTGGAIIEDLSLSVRHGEILGLVGESGSGKTTVALALLGLTRRGARIAGGSVRVDRDELIGRSEKELRRLRGRVVSYVPQEPGVALNPAIRVGSLIRELAQLHRPDLDPDVTVRAVLDRAQLPSDDDFTRRFPHQLSGGQQQRLAIAMAVVCEPKLIVLDEPTTGLDVVTQRRILDEVKRLRDELDTSMVYVSHDLAVVAAIADRIAVMYAGRLVEEGPSHATITEPHHPYTQGLVSSIPDHAVPRRLAGIPGVAVGVGDRPAGCAFAPRCMLKTPACEVETPALERVGPASLVRCLRWRETPAVAVQLRIPQEGRDGQALLGIEELRAGYRGRSGLVLAAESVSFSVASAECVALVGESGSGKTTIARCIVGLHRPDSGRVLLDRAPLPAVAKDRSPDSRRRVQIVFQNPYESLNPRHRVEDALSWAARRLRGIGRNEARRDVELMLEHVRLPRSIAARYPTELSGGERQRVAIARALVAHPDLLVCDEVTSALDVSVQAAVLDLLCGLQRDLGLAMLFITHDLGLVASVADRVVVLERGVICESGTVRKVLASPAHEYTQNLVKAAPHLPAGSAARSP